MIISISMDEAPKIELVRETEEPESKGEGPSSSRLNQWLARLVAHGGSDLLLVSGVEPCIRVHGEIVNLETRTLEGGEIEDAVMPALSGYGAKQYKETHIADSSYRVSGLGRFRINLHRERGRAAAAIRALPAKVPGLKELHLPGGLEALTRLQRGLVLVGGQAGAGKTTTLASLIHEINRREARHIITIEDPIEYEHQNIRSVIEQIEIGSDAPDFPTALRASLRQAPDIIVVGEMRDPETMRIAVSAAETGHLVFSTVHTTDMASTVSRISDSFPLERQNTIRQELSMALSAVVTQMLVPGKSGRLPAAELLMVGYGARQHIRRNALQHLHQEITISKRAGSFSLEESLVELVAQGHISREDALLYAIHPDDVEAILRGRGTR
ncbi:MAG TPA: PilT/PilU family type 4a pilus ATPase [Candidatus Limnocylindrales bacterium]|nr:PilT/PilU family type 4a pilus ATPase [Candidatus Limnocylindrales bacterium]